MFRHLSIGSFALLSATATSRTKRTTSGAKRPASLQFPIHYNPIPVHYQRLLRWIFYYRLLQPYRPQADLVPPLAERHWHHRAPTASVLPLIPPQPMCRQSYPFLADTKRPRCNRHRPLLRPQTPMIRPPTGHVHVEEHPPTVKATAHVSIDAL